MVLTQDRIKEYMDYIDMYKVYYVSVYTQW